MRKEALVLLAAFALSACSGAGVAVSGGGELPGGGGKMKDEVSSSPKPSPEEDPKAPGMIPKDCELLLNQAQAWGYVAGSNNDWKPASTEQALEVSKFFSTFHLVPESTSNYTRAWLQEPAPESEAAAKKSLERMARAQTCDLLLAHKLLLGVVNYPWGKADRELAAKFLHSFVLNQQARVAPSLARAVQLDVLGRMVHKRFLRADAKAIKKIQAWFDAETAKGLKRAEEITSDRDHWKLSREEVRLSEDARERLGKLLPLP